MDIRIDAEAEPHRVARRGVRILAHDENPDAIKGRFERAENVIRSWKVAAAGCNLGAEEVAHGVDAVLNGREGASPAGINELIQRSGHGSRVAGKSWEKSVIGRWENERMADELSELEQAVLAFEKSPQARTRTKSSAIRTEVGVSPTRYYRILNSLLTSPAALNAEPMLMSRLMRLREQRQSERRMPGRA